MSIQISVYIATSLDGFIARANGDLDWLTNGDGTSSDEDYGYQAFMDTVDVIVMGRHSFEKVLTFDSWPYPEHKVVVLSSANPAILADISDKVELLSAEPDQVVQHLEANGFTHVYLDGGLTIQRFLKAGLVDDLIITRIPVLIGDGIPLFGRLDHDIKLLHVSTRHFENGFVQSRYQVPTTE